MEGRLLNMLHKTDTERERAVKDTTHEIIRILENENIPLPVLLDIRKQLAEYETPTEYQVVLDRTGVKFEK